jgi:lysylphosphatidylglycerol synthetase-like protein (DUF2156 family)
MSQSKSSIAIRLFWPAPILGLVLLFLRTADDQLKLLLGFIAFIFVLSLLQLLVVAVARRVDLVPLVLGALALLVIAAYFAVALLLAGIGARHGPDISVESVYRSYAIALALVYPALLLLGRSVLQLSREPPSSPSVSNAIHQTKIRPAEYEGADAGLCPNCDAKQKLDAAQCALCGAQFGPGSAWALRPIPGNRRSDAA